MELSGKIVMITGGTGSFGNALIRHLTAKEVHTVVYSRDESKQHDMYSSGNFPLTRYIVGDVRDKDKLIQSLKSIDYVFHAGALKHVPTGEKWPEEVIQTNVLGTKNVVEAADYCGVKALVDLSTDKAAYPVSSYGMSKALAEKVAYKTPRLDKDGIDWEIEKVSQIRNYETPAPQAGYGSFLLD